MQLDNLAFVAFGKAVFGASRIQVASMPSDGVASNGVMDDGSWYLEHFRSADEVFWRTWMRPLR